MISEAPSTRLSTRLLPKLPASEFLSNLSLTKLTKLIRYSEIVTVYGTVTSTAAPVYATNTYTATATEIDFLTSTVYAQVTAVHTTYQTSYATGKSYPAFSCLA